MVFLKGINNRRNWQLLLIRWMKFNAVGAGGVLVQLVAVTFLIGLLDIHYLPATFLAVEAAVLHNFAWHERWTWSDRTTGGLPGMFRRLFRFNFTTGAMSIGGNLILMRLFVGFFHFHFLPAQFLTIATCNIFNFLVSHLFVFRSSTSLQD